jgi:hypothetical protein
MNTVAPKIVIFFVLFVFADAGLKEQEIASFFILAVDTKDDDDFFTGDIVCLCRRVSSVLRRPW